MGEGRLIQQGCCHSAKLILVLPHFHSSLCVWFILMHTDGKQCKSGPQTAHFLKSTLCLCAWIYANSFIPLRGCVLASVFANLAIRASVCICVCVSFPEVDCLQLVGHLVLCDSFNPIKSWERQTGRGCQSKPCRTTQSERKSSLLCACSLVFLSFCSLFCLYSVSIQIIQYIWVGLRTDLFLTMCHIVHQMKTFIWIHSKFRPWQLKVPPLLFNMTILCWRETRTRDGAATLVILVFCLNAADSTRQNDSLCILTDRWYACWKAFCPG